MGGRRGVCRSRLASQSTATVVLMPKKYKDVRKAFIDAGWRVVRQSGSHEVWAHTDHEARIVVAGKDRDTVPVGTLGSIRRASGLEHLR
jgi:predicted RNA binding protein YcfA (HicA-like mRNA interferase family)